jgi:hypothetical protein
VLEPLPCGQLSPSDLRKSSSGCAAGGAGASGSTVSATGPARSGIQPSLLRSHGPMRSA